MTAVVDLQHNGMRWVLNVTPEDSNGSDTVEIEISDADKDKLVAQGVEIYEG